MFQIYTHEIFILIWEQLSLIGKDAALANKRPRTEAYGL